MRLQKNVTKNSNLFIGGSSRNKYEIINMKSNLKFDYTHYLGLSGIFMLATVPVLGEIFLYLRLLSSIVTIVGGNDVNGFIIKVLFLTSQRGQSFNL